MSHSAPDDEIARWLPLLRQRQFAKASEQLQALEPTLGLERPALLEGCKLLLQWYGRPLATHYEVGLPGAITGVSILRDEGYRPLIAWDMASVGYAMGVLGDLETGIAWLDVAQEDIHSLGDQRGEIYFLAHKGSLLAYADALDESRQVFEQALALCTGPHEALRGGVLNSIAYWHVIKARQRGNTDLEVQAQAQLAVKVGRQALALMQGNPEFARFECSALENLAQGLTLLGDHEQAEALFEKGLRKATSNRDAQFGLLVGQAELMLREGRLKEAGSCLQQAVEKQSMHQVGMMTERLFMARIELARRSGAEEAAQSLWQERLHWEQDRYRERLRRVHEHAEVQARLMRLQSQARATRLELRAAELALLQSRLQIEQTRQQERESVMLNLHDGLGSQLATARLRAQWGELTQEDLVFLLEECMADLHLVVDTLSSDEGDLGRALRLLRNRSNTRLAGSGIEIDWDLAVDDAPALSQVLVTNVLRVLQEALTNALKHARARHIRVQCHYEAPSQTLRMQVSDDGQGIPKATLASMAADPGALETSGKGLQNLRQRARRVGGELEFSALSPGTQIEFRLQLPDPPEHGV